MRARRRLHHHGDTSRRRVKGRRHAARHAHRADDRVQQLSPSLALTKAHCFPGPPEGWTCNLLGGDVTLNFQGTRYDASIETDLLWPRREHPVPRTPTEPPMTDWCCSCGAKSHVSPGGVPRHLDAGRTNASANQPHRPEMVVAVSAYLGQKGFRRRPDGGSSRVVRKSRLFSLHQASARIPLACAARPKQRDDPYEGLE